MFRAMITPILRSTRLCVTACGIVNRRCCRPVAWKLPLPGYRPATSWVHRTTNCNTQSSAPEDGRDHRPKHVELIGTINKPLLLDLVGVYIIYVRNEVHARCFPMKYFEKNLPEDGNNVKCRNVMCLNPSMTASVRGTNL